MKAYNITAAKLNWYRALNCSQYGNPKFEARFDFINEDGEEDCIVGKTATDASCAYGITNYANGKRLADVQYHYTRTGNIIIDYIHDSM